MAEEILIAKSLTKEEKYRQLLPQIKGLVEHENDPTANLANISSALKYGMHFFWVGFYLVREKELVLGPFQGTVACTRIAFGKGVCGTCWKEQKTIIVDDVEKFPGHIACSSLSKSEIVVPVFDVDNKVFAVLDIDSDSLSTFDDIDKIFLEELAEMISRKLLTRKKE